MKTNFKRFIGLFLALTMLLGLTVNVNAEETTALDAYSEIKFVGNATGHNYGTTSGNAFGSWNSGAYAEFASIDFGTDSPKAVTVKAGSQATYQAPIKIYIIDESVDTSEYSCESGFLKDGEKNSVTHSIIISAPTYDGWSNYNEQKASFDLEVTGKKKVFVATGNNSNLHSIQFFKEAHPVDAFVENAFSKVGKATGYNSITDTLGSWVGDGTAYVEIQNVDFGETGANKVTVWAGSGTTNKGRIVVYAFDGAEDMSEYSIDLGTVKKDGTVITPNAELVNPEFKGWSDYVGYEMTLNETLTGKKTLWIATSCVANLKSIRFAYDESLEEPEEPTTTVDAYQNNNFADVAVAHNYTGTTEHFGGWSGTAYAEIRNVDFGEEGANKVTVYAGSGADYTGKIMVYALDENVDLTNYSADYAQMKYQENSEAAKVNVSAVAVYNGATYNGWENWKGFEMKLNETLTGKKTILVATGCAANLKSIQFSTEAIAVDPYKVNKFADAAIPHNYGTTSPHFGSGQDGKYYAEIDNVVFGDEGAIKVTVNASSSSSLRNDTSPLTVRVYAVDQTVDTSEYTCSAGFLHDETGVNVTPVAELSGESFTDFSTYFDITSELSQTLTGTKKIFVGTVGAVNLMSIEFSKQTAYDTYKFVNSEYTDYSANSAGAIGGWKTTSFAKFENIDFGEPGAAKVTVNAASNPGSSKVALSIRIYAVDSETDTTGYYASGGYVKDADGKDFAPIAVISCNNYTDFDTYIDESVDLSSILSGKKTIFVATVGAINLKTIKFDQVSLGDSIEIISPETDKEGIGTIDANGQKLEIKFSNYFNSADIEGKISFVAMDDNDNELPVRGGYEIIKSSGVINNVTLKFGRLDKNGVYVLKVKGFNSIVDGVALGDTELYLVAEAVEENFVFGIIKDEGYANKQIVYTLNDDVDETTLENLSVKDSDQKDVSMSYAYDKNTRKLTLTFPDGLKKAVNYTLSFGGVKNSSGDTLTYTKTIYIADTFAIKSVSFKADSLEVEKISDINFANTDEITANVKFVNLSDDSESVCVIVAVYDGEKLVKTGLNSITVGKTTADGSLYMPTVDVSDIETTGDYKVKLFVWDSITNCKPIFAPYTLDGNGVCL